MLWERIQLRVGLTDQKRPWQGPQRMRSWDRAGTKAISWPLRACELGRIAQLLSRRLGGKVTEGPRTRT